MTSTHSGDQDQLLRSTVRRQTLDLLTAAAEGKGLTLADLGEQIGLHPTTLRFHLHLLVDAGLVVDSNEVVGVGRPRKRYAIAPAPQTSDESYKMLAQLLAHAFSNPGVTPEQAGYDWAYTSAGIQPAAPSGGNTAWLAAVGAVVDVFTQWGYEASLSVAGDPDDVEIRLDQCPFRELALAQPDVVCGLHRGLMRGAVEAAGQRGARVDLEPFAQGPRCIGHLRRQQANSFATPSASDPNTPSADPARRTA